MVKHLLFLVSLLLLVAGCGQKSTIKNSVEARKLSEMYGDGRLVTKTVTFALDDSSLAFKTPLPGLGPIAGGIVKLVGDIFASNTKMGELEMSYTVPIPPIPTDIVQSVKLTRFFFYMKPKEGKRRVMRDWIDWIGRYVFGRGETTFNFLEKLAVRMSTSEVDDPGHYVSELQSKLPRRNLESLLRVFTENYRERVVDTESAKDLVLLKYHKKSRERDTSGKLYGKIHYFETAGVDDPAAVKLFLLKQPYFREHYKRIVVLDKALLIELQKDPVSDEVFKAIMQDNMEKIQELGVNYTDTCAPESCLELSIPDVNLVPIASKGNALSIEGFVQANRVPESFKLKGFVEFEVKFDPII